MVIFWPILDQVPHVTVDENVPFPIPPFRLCNMIFLFSEKTFIKHKNSSKTKLKIWRFDYPLHPLSDIWWHNSVPTTTQKSHTTTWKWQPLLKSVQIISWRTKRYGWKRNFLNWKSGRLNHDLNRLFLPIIE